MTLPIAELYGRPRSPLLQESSPSPPAPSLRPASSTSNLDYDRLNASSDRGSYSTYRTSVSFKPTDDPFAAKTPTAERTPIRSHSRNDGEGGPTSLDPLHEEDQSSVGRGTPSEPRHSQGKPRRRASFLRSFVDALPFKPRRTRSPAHLSISAPLRHSVQPSVTPPPTRIPLAQVTATTSPNRSGHLESQRYPSGSSSLRQASVTKRSSLGSLFRPSSRLSLRRDPQLEKVDEHEVGLALTTDETASSTRNMALPSAKSPALTPSTPRLNGMIPQIAMTAPTPAKPNARLRPRPPSRARSTGQLGGSGNVLDEEELLLRTIAALMHSSGVRPTMFTLLRRRGTLASDAPGALAFEAVKRYLTGVAEQRYLLEDDVASTNRRLDLLEDENEGWRKAIAILVERASEESRPTEHASAARQEGTLDLTGIVSASSSASELADLFSELRQERAALQHLAQAVSSGLRALERATSDSQGGPLLTSPPVTTADSSANPPSCTSTPLRQQARPFRPLTLTPPGVADSPIPTYGRVTVRKGRSTKTTPDEEDSTAFTVHLIPMKRIPASRSKTTCGVST
ncbi:hypothetical protein BMF94_5723 [Rhodotorula taiwanensis]|uniref:Uncharacterized protein n=1 Tax=Rhodotorula taiwanensis TaxID=741276 RepID=A0A2S5B3Z0_9BASI|nr:hypothetical protein BMF94_5723 [Rhodotorula taiwanensis]